MNGDRIDGGAVMGRCLLATAVEDKGSSTWKTHRGDSGFERCKRLHNQTAAAVR